MIMYLVIFCAFVVMCHIYYGAELLQFGTLATSMSSLFVMLMGDLKWALDDMFTLSPTLSFFLFIAFITSMQFILMNMFIAFISNAYSEVNRKLLLAKQRKAAIHESEAREQHWAYRVQSAAERVGRWCWRRREAPVVKRGRREVAVEEVAVGVRPEPEEEPRTAKAKGLKRVTNIFTVEENEGSNREEHEDG